MAEEMVVRLIDAQRRRLIATILGHAERTFWPQLNTEQREDFRVKVLDAVASFSDFTRDVVKVADHDFVRNERALELIEAIHSDQRHLLQRITDG